jgi:AmmeMemoRadiSam system protein A
MPVSPSSELTAGDRQALLDLARRSIRHGLEYGRALSMASESLSPALQAPGASFVTLNEYGRLRGCIGSLEAHRPLAEDVARNAYAAAFRDPRFPPLGADELGRIELQVSVLTPSSPIPADSEAALLAALRPGIDGVVLEQDGRGSTFLPQVWEQLPEPHEFLRQLRRKAGLPDGYDPRARYFRYQVEHFGE